MHETHVDDESRRTAALALWRYGHDYLKAARTLCENDHIACNESQALYHLAAQGIEFALKSHLRAKGVTPGDLSARIGHSLLDALQEAMARDLAPPPVDVLRAIQLIAPAGTWILAQTAKDVVADYFAYHGHASAPASEEMLRLMRADLQMTVRNIPTLQ